MTLSRMYAHLVTDDVALLITLDDAVAIFDRKLVRHVERSALETAVRS